MKARARRLAETRQRITEAAVRLHETVGPARTTVSEVARLAGVQRMTVYNHFPSDVELLDACSGHWLAQNPPPDPAAWTAVADPQERLLTALRQLYAWYRAGRDMMGNSLRDEPLVPGLAAIMAAKWWPYVEAVDAALGEGLLDGATRPASVRAALRLAVAFPTWRTLADAGLDDAAAAALAAAFVAVAR
ncbi:MAG: TetR/AcrR family transcriptional regulator [Candidatus Krumholzibacteriia bacterium]